jgi:hypothetical protein
MIANRQSESLRHKGRDRSPGLTAVILDEGVPGHIPVIGSDQILKLERGKYETEGEDKPAEGHAEEEKYQEESEEVQRGEEVFYLIAFGDLYFLLRRQEKIERFLPTSKEIGFYRE